MAAAPLIMAGVSMWGAMEKGDQQAGAYRAEAINKRAEAAQVQIAADRQAGITLRNYQKLQGAQIAAYGQGNVELSGSPLLQMEQSASDAYSQIKSIQDSGRYHVTSILTEGAYDDRLAGQAEDAGMLNAVGAGISGFSSNSKARGNL